MERNESGLRGHRLYPIWSGMKDRCLNKNNKRYSSYGGRGIEVCKEWQQSFRAFLRWAMANGYEEGLSIDRIDNDGNYCPENCRWATAKEQANNKRWNHLITYNGKTQTMKEWAEELGIKLSTLSQRINSYRWSDEKALTTPVRKYIIETKE